MKKGQIGSGLSWVAGFLVIFFIMVLFASSIVIIAGTRTIDERARDEILFEEGSSGELIEIKTIIALINSEVGDCFWVDNDFNNVVSQDFWDNYDRESTYFDLLEDISIIQPPRDILPKYLYVGSSYLYSPGVGIEHYLPVGRILSGEYYPEAQRANVLLFSRCLSREFDNNNLYPRYIEVGLRDGKKLKLGDTRHLGVSTHGYVDLFFESEGTISYINMSYSNKDLIYENDD